MRSKNLLPLTSDIVFKAAFGRDTPESKKALIAILNIILEREGEEAIVDLVYKNPFVYAEFPDDKTVILDIKAVTQRGEWIGVEMQVVLSDWFIDRTVYYNGKLICEQLEAGESYDKLKKSITISIVCGTLFPQSRKLMTVFRHKEIDENFELDGISELRYLELGKIDDTWNPTEMSRLESVAAYLKYAGDEKRTEYVEKLLTTGGEVIKMSEQILEKISEDERLRQLQISRQIAEVYRRLDLGGAHERGVKEGRAEGMAEGMERGVEQGIKLVKTALKMKEMGKTAAEICELTGLSEEQIEDL